MFKSLELWTHVSVFLSMAVLSILTAAVISPSYAFNLLPIWIVMHIFIRLMGHLNAE